MDELLRKLEKKAEKKPKPKHTTILRGHPLLDAIRSRVAIRVQNLAPPEWDKPLVEPEPKPKLEAPSYVV